MKMARLVFMPSGIRGSIRLQRKEKHVLVYNVMKKVKPSALLLLLWCRQLVQINEGSIPMIRTTILMDKSATISKRQTVACTGLES